MTDPYTAGYNAFFDNEGQLYNGASDDWKDGYKDAWRNYNTRSLQNDMSGDWEADAWEAHCREEMIEGYARINTGELSFEPARRGSQYAGGR